MVADPFNVIDELCPDICLKFLRQVIHAAGEHEVLPHDQAQLVAGVPEGIRRIMAAAPDTDAVEMGVFRLRQKLMGPLRRHTGQDVVLRNIIRAHGKDAHAVHLMAEAFSPLVLFARYGHCPQADPLFPHIQNRSPAAQLRFHAVQRLLSIAVRPPELRVFDHSLHPARFHRLYASVRSGHSDTDFHAFLRKPGRILLRSVPAQAVQPLRSQKFNIRLKI